MDMTEEKMMMDTVYSEHEEIDYVQLVGKDGLERRVPQFMKVLSTFHNLTSLKLDFGGHHSHYKPNVPNSTRIVLFGTLSASLFGPLPI
jgi:hypothetical protein